MSSQPDSFDLWLDEALASAAHVQTPIELRSEITRSLARQQRRYGLRWAAAAACIALVAFWPRSTAHLEPAPLASSTTVHLEPMAAFIPSQELIAIEHESPAPNVTVIQLYPTTSAEQSWARQALLERTQNSYDGG